MVAEIVKTEMAGKTDICPGIKSFFFRPTESFEYKAGQYSLFSFEHDSKEYSKPFTISNSPTRENIEMTTILSGSDYKNALDSLEKGHIVNIKGPLGSFTLDALKEEYVCFLAGGVGITPVKSILEYAADESRTLKGCLFYSNRTPDRIAFAEELDGFADKLSGFRIINTLTSLSPEEEQSWTGERGYIDEEMIKRNFPRYSDSRFYIVGPPAFNGAMKKMLSENLGVSGELITLENFAGY